jgi:DNA-binding NarL/FixJ family response regulator
MNGYTNNQLVKVAIAEDHQLFRQGISVIINTWENHKVTHQAGNGQELIDMLHNRNLPDIALIDLQMPVLNGYETIKVLKEKFPDLKTMGFSCFKAKKLCGGL